MTPSDAAGDRAVPWRIVAALTLLGAVLRLPTLAVQSFDLDELSSAWIAGLPLGESMATVGRMESTPHLFYLVSWSAAHVAHGSPEIVLRAFPALCGTLTVPVVALAALEIGTRRIAVLAGALTATNPLLVWFSQQARAYAPLVLLTALGLLAALRAARDPRPRRLAAWSAWSALALVTHYFAAFAIAGQAALLLARVSPRRLVAAAAAVPLAVGAALVPLVYQQREHPGGFDVSPIVRLAQIPKDFVVGIGGPAEVPVAIIAGTLLMVMVAPLGRAWRAQRREFRALLLMLGGSLGLPVVLASLGLDYVAVRNVLPALIPCILLAGAIAATTRAGTVATLALCILSMLITAAVALDPVLRRPNWRGLERAMGPAQHPRAIVTQPDTAIGPMAVYYERARPVGAAGAVVSEILLGATFTENAFTVGRRPKPPTPGPVRPPRGFTVAERRMTSTYTLVRLEAPRPTRVNLRALRSLGLDRDEPVAAFTQRLAR